ncbi:MAG: filamentous hemagglutinin N-terminal domain-containing protein [Symploca sp. SIO2E9]|nr:filamentous hemagglutinin N-terminal domain-containing protein [Symploca sp. SIO2E9]
MVLKLKNSLTIAGSIPLIAWLAYASWFNRAFAQITPDTSLGNESSVVTPNVDLKGGLADLIEGGAIRDINLFHSFLEFNVPDGGRVYFANPAGIESIFTRVTGNNVSNILGTLGVDGAANLFLLNPNGIVFGNNAQLDVEGSFFGTTANSLVFGDGSEFSATNPNQPPLLKVSAPLGLQYGANSTAAIANSGNLAVPEDLTLAGNNLDLHGQLYAGGDLKLQAENAVEINDSVAQQFIAAAGGELVIQGNESVDIFALNHPDSGLFAGGNLLLRSANSVGGDAHYWSGGSFRIEKLDGSLGSLFSPIDPIIRTFGDVVIGQYTGTSLHILAGGSVTLNSATISAPDPGTAGVDFLKETIELSDDTPVEINGEIQPTLDIRAGVLPQSIGIPPLESLTGFNPATDVIAENVTEASSSGNITIGNVLITDSNGLVLLTNQYRPNPELPSANILVAGDEILNIGINTGIAGEQGGSIFLDSRENINVLGNIQTFSSIGSSGHVRLIAQGETKLVGGSIVTRLQGTGDAGDIEINTGLLTLQDGNELSANTLGKGSAGNIRINAREEVLIEGEASDGSGSSGIFSVVESTAVGDGGTVTINADSLILRDGATISTSTVGEGLAGNIVIKTSDSVVLEGEGNTFFTAIASIVAEGAVGEGGDISIETGSLTIRDSAQLIADTLGMGSAGNIHINASELVLIEGEFSDGSGSNGIFSAVESTAVGNGGIITIDANSLILRDGAGISTSTVGEGLAGNIRINARDSILLEGQGDNFVSAIVNIVGENAEGESGDIDINTGSFSIRNGSRLVANTRGKGSAGDIRINARETIKVEGESGIFSAVESTAIGNGGIITIDADSLILRDGATISTSTVGEGLAGNILIKTSDSVVLEGEGNTFLTAIASIVAEDAVGEGGDISIDTGSLIIRDSGQLVVNTRDLGPAGNIHINARDFVLIEGEFIDGSGSSGIFSAVESTAAGDGGIVTIDADILILRDGATISTSTVGEGSAGDLILNTKELLITDGAQVSARSEGTAPAGDITLNIGRLLSATDGEISTNASQSAGGAIKITAQNIQLFGDSDIRTNVSNGEDNGGDIELTANSIIAFDDSDILAFARDGKGGDITFKTPAFFGENYRPAPRGTDPVTLDGNNRVDINASGGIDGVIILPDVSFIQNSITDLPDELVNPDSLIAGSCIIPTNEPQGSLYIIGAGGLPTRPGDISVAPYPTGIVKPIGSSGDSPDSAPRTHRRWQKGDPIIEPTGVYQLPNGKLVMGRECSR